MVKFDFGFIFISIKSCKLSISLLFSSRQERHARSMLISSFDIFQTSKMKLFEINTKTDCFYHIKVSLVYFLKSSTELSVALKMSNCLLDGILNIVQFVCYNTRTLVGKSSMKFELYILNPN